MHIYCIKFSKDKREVLYLGWANPLDRPDTDYLGSSSAEIELEVQVDSGLNTSQQLALVARKAKNILGYSYRLSSH